jgi:hypothetical protein
VDSFTTENWMLADVDSHYEVAGWTADPPRRTLSRNADCGSILDPGRNSDFDLTVASLYPTTGALVAAVLDLTAGPPAVVARAGHCEQALADGLCAGSAADRTGHHVAAGFGAAALAATAREIAIHSKSGGCSFDCLTEREIQISVDVGARLGATGSAAGRVAKTGEEIR